MTTAKPDKTNCKTIAADVIAVALDELATAVVARIGQCESLAVVGIANGGITLARRLRERLNAVRSTPVGEGIIDIAFYRDDLGRNPIPKVTQPTAFNFDVNCAHVLLCDDVIFSGRSVRAALNDLFDQGRPAAVELAVVCDRGGRRLPIQPDYTAISLAAAAHEKVQVFLDPLDPHNDLITLNTHE
jgi:pyrimidine operon attenuation protein/uracil phosphoribosyltransferase